jgi:hypothetical protein
MHGFNPKAKIMTVLKHLRISVQDDDWLQRIAQEKRCSHAAIIRECIRLVRESEGHEGSNGDPRERKP